MKKLLLSLLLSTSPLVAYAQTYPSPTFNTMTLNSPLGLSSGGVGSTTAAGARVNLGAAASGANSDITSLTGLTTAVPLTEGGTGGTTAATLSDPRYASGVFAPLSFVVGASVNGNASIFVSQSANQNSFPVSVTALAHLESGAAGGATSGFYSECAQDAAGVCETEEVDTFNSAGAPYASLTPPNRSIGTTQIIPIGYLASAGSRTGYTNNSWAAYDAESNTADWYVGYYANPSALTGYAFADGLNWFVAANGQQTINPGTLSAGSAAALTVESTVSGGGAGGQIALLNTGSGVSTPDKSIRIDSAGNFGIMNSGYTAQILTLSDAGSLSTTGGINGTPLGNISPSTVAATTISATGAITPSQNYGIVGTTTNNNANAGSVGEYIFAAPSGISVAAGAITNIGSITLTPGDWTCSGGINYSTVTTASTNIQAYLSTVSAGSSSTALAGTLNIDVFSTGGITSGTSMPTGQGRLLISASTTLYLVGYISGGGTASGYEACRRAR